MCISELQFEHIWYCICVLQYVTLCFHAMDHFHFIFISFHVHFVSVLLFHFVSIFYANLKQERGGSPVNGAWEWLYTVAIASAKSFTMLWLSQIHTLLCTCALYTVVDPESKQRGTPHHLRNCAHARKIYTHLCGKTNGEKRGGPGPWNPPWIRHWYSSDDTHPVCLALLVALLDTKKWHIQETWSVFHDWCLSHERMSTSTSTHSAC